jgi:hypothetical protein
VLDQLGQGAFGVGPGTRRWDGGRQLPSDATGACPW